MLLGNYGMFQISTCESRLTPKTSRGFASVYMNHAP